MRTYHENLTTARHRDGAVGDPVRLPAGYTRDLGIPRLFAGPVMLRIELDLGDDQNHDRETIENHVRLVLDRHSDGYVTMVEAIASCPDCGQDEPVDAQLCTSCGAVMVHWCDMCDATRRRSHECEEDPLTPHEGCEKGGTWYTPKPGAVRDNEALRKRRGLR